MWVRHRMSVVILTGHTLCPAHVAAGSTQKHWPFPSDRVETGYAYLLTHPGMPCIFYDHYFEWGKELRNKIHTMLKVGGAHAAVCPLHAVEPLPVVEACIFTAAAFAWLEGAAVLFQLCSCTAHVDRLLYPHQCMPCQHHTSCPSSCYCLATSLTACCAALCVCMLHGLLCATDSPPQQHCERQQGGHQVRGGGHVCGRH